MSKLTNGNRFGFIKPAVDVHTMGLFTIANLLRDCGKEVFIANDHINTALEKIHKLNNYSLLKNWIIRNHIDYLCYSYRLDPQEGCDFFMMLYGQLQSDNMFIENKGPIKGISFAGLPDTCRLISQYTHNKVLFFRGNESPIESLKMYGVSEKDLPPELKNNHPYDEMRWNFAKELIESEQYKKEQIQDHFGYKECGKQDDSILYRLNYAQQKHTLPLIRTHSGPYNPNRLEALKEYNSWCKVLAGSQFLDILSIGSSQLTQSHFGESWADMPNGGGVPVNSETEYRIIKENAIPMLVRTYAGTKDILKLARIHERSLNICWHALSFWWFNELDGRGKNSLLENLKEHFETVRYIASIGKPVEPNVPHHFAFRGTDDVSYIVSGYLASKACKQLGVKHLILQNMLNTPKYTWGVQDLAKGRAMLRLIRELEDGNFRVSLQTRAGLNFFVPDLEKAKIQLSAVTCLMDDIEPGEIDSPQIIHVVNYCEAVRLATPPVIIDSIKITLNSLHAFRHARKKFLIPDMRYDHETSERTENLYEESKDAIRLLEDYIPNLYSPEGFNIVFSEGFFPVPYLMDPNKKYPKATQWHTALKNGGVRVVNEHGHILSTTDRYKKIISNMELS